MHGARQARLFFGWRVVGAAFVFAVFSWGILFYGFSVFLHAIHATQQWPVSLISAAITWHYLLSAAIVVYLDDAHRRWGIVAVTRAGVVALATGALGWALAQAPWQLFAAAVPTPSAGQRPAGPRSTPCSFLGSGGGAAWRSASLTTAPASAA